MPSTFTVTDNSDCTSDTGSLRYALNHLAAGGNTIDFNITGGNTTIDLTSSLPTITQQVSILGYTQGGTNYNGPPLIVLNGASAGSGASGLDFAAGSNGSEVQGLVIQGFDSVDGILINGTSDNQIVGNYIGTDSTGTAKLGNSVGVDIQNGATNNTVGGTSSGAANVISGNRVGGVYLEGGGTSGNVVLGNLIGTDIHGTAKLGNTYNGVFIGYSATANTVGGTSTGAANVISGNSNDGVYLYGSGTSGNVVLGNLIGTDINGTAGLGNKYDGLDIQHGATANTVGGTVSGAANVISGNTDGVYLAGSGTSGNVVLGNLIGTDIHGTAKLGNTDGVLIAGGAAGARRATRWAARSAAPPTSSPATPTACIWLAAGRVATWCWAISSAPISTAPPSSATPTACSSRGARRGTRWEVRAPVLSTSSPATTLACICVIAERVATWCWATSSAPISTAPPISATPPRVCSSRMAHV